MSKKTTAANSLQLEGNNGGDFLEITVLPDSLVSIRVGHCCVATDTKVIPVELLTATLFPIISGDWHTAIDATAWPKDFKDALKNKANR